MGDEGLTAKQIAMLFNRGDLFGHIEFVRIETLETLRAENAELKDKIEMYRAAMAATNAPFYKTIDALTAKLAAAEQFIASANYYDKDSLEKAQTLLAESKTGKDET